MTMANANVRTGIALGAGAALNVSLGWIPRRVDVFNVTDGTKQVTGFPDSMIQFNTGVTAPPYQADGKSVAPGFKITGITSGAVAKVKDYVLISGTFAAGSAAGFWICDADDVVGTFTTENYTLSTSAAGAVDGALVLQVEHSIYTSATAGPVSGAAATTGIASYVGDGTHAKGFTIGSTVAASGKLLRWEAFRN